MGYEKLWMSKLSCVELTLSIYLDLYLYLFLSFWNRESQEKSTSHCWQLWAVYFTDFADFRKNKIDLFVTYSSFGQVMIF